MVKHRYGIGGLFVPTVRPGHRAPNVVVGEGETLFDQFR